MKARHQVSRAAIELVKQFEGYRRASARLPDGGWTIGHGHTQSARQGATVDDADAEALLIYDLMKTAAVVGDLTYTPLSSNQFGALTAFAFNVGVTVFSTSNVLRLVNEGAMLEAAYALESWRKAELDGDERVIDGLIRRRAAEKTLFLTPDDGFVPVPSAIIRPRLDPEALFSDVVFLAPLMEGEVAIVVGGIVSPHDKEPQAAPPADVANDPADAQPAPVDPLYDIPGYAAPPQAPRQAVNSWAASLRAPHLLTLGLGGAVLLLVAFLQAMKGASSIGAASTSAYGVAAFAGLIGAAVVFAVVFLFLDRMDQQGD